MISRQRKKTEETLRENEIKFRTVFEHSLDAIGVSKSGIHILVNPAYLSLFGYPNESELIGKSILELIAPSEHRKIIAYVNRRNKGEYVPNTYETKGLRKDGSEFDMEVHVSSYEQQQEIYTLVILRDITERNRAEKALRESEERFRKLISASPDGITIVNSEGKITFVSDKMFKLYGSIDINEVIGHSPLEWISPEHRERAKINIANVLKGAQHLSNEYLLLKNDGSTFWGEITSSTINDISGKPIGIVSITRDITARKQAEQALRESEEKFRAVAQTSVAAIFIYQEDKFVYANPATEMLSEYSSDELLKMNFWEFVHPDYRDLVKQRGTARLKGKAITNRYEFKIVTKSGKERWLDFGAGFIIFGAKPAAIGIAFDITERINAEEALRKSEKKYRLLHESITDAYAAVTMDGNIIEFNSSYLSMLGYTAEEITRLSYLDITPEKWHQYETKIVQDEVIPFGYSSIYEKEYRKKDGTIFPVELRTFLIRDEKGNPEAMWALIRDITERKQAEEKLNNSFLQMRQLTARLQAIREEESTRIAREIHDELGQILTAIKMDLSFVEEGIRTHSEQIECTEVLTKIGSMEQLVDGAIQTVRKITTELRPAILDSLGLSAAIEWQSEEFQKRTGIKCNYKSSAMNFHLDRDCSTAIFRILQESLTNIIKHSKATNVDISLTVEADSLIFTVQDNGQGINDADMKKINSFGILGMKERAALLGGSFDISGTNGQGTKICVRIPITT